MNQNGDAALDPQSAVVHQATGMIMAQCDLPLSAAAERLHQYAAGARRPVVDVAKDIVAGRLDLSR
jgi:hypothetical protein